LHWRLSLPDIGKLLDIKQLSGGYQKPERDKAGHPSSPIETLEKFGG
jgi:hypothetical protein